MQEAHLQEAHLQLAKQLIELKFKVKVLYIEFEDGSGKKFNVITTDNPAKKYFLAF